MVIQHVRLRSGLSEVETRTVMEERASRFRQVSGLVQVYFAREEESGDLCGIYLFNSRAALVNFRQSELARTMSSAYRAEATQVETYELLFPLHADRGVPTRLAT